MGWLAVEIFPKVEHQVKEVKSRQDLEGVQILSARDFPARESARLVEARQHGPLLDTQLRANRPDSVDEPGWTEKRLRGVH